MLNKTQPIQNSNNRILDSLNFVGQIKASHTKKKDAAAKLKYPNTFNNLSKANINPSHQIVFVFDIDDTLVKTMKLIFDCFKDSVKNLTKEQQNELIGKNLQEFTDKFLDPNFAKGKIDIMVSKIEEQLISKEKLASSPRKDYDDKYKDVELIDNAVETLKLLNKIKKKTGLNIKTVLFSNNYMDNLQSSTACKQLFPHADAIFSAEREYFTDDKGIKKSRTKLKGKPNTEALVDGLNKNNISVSSDKSIFFGIGDRKTDIQVFDNLKNENKSHIGSCFYLDTHARSGKEARSESVAVDSGRTHKDLQEWIKLATDMIKNHIDEQIENIEKAA